MEWENAYWPPWSIGAWRKLRSLYPIHFAGEKSDHNPIMQNKNKQNSNSASSQNKYYIKY